MFLSVVVDLHIYSLMLVAAAATAAPAVSSANGEVAVCHEAQRRLLAIQLFGPGDWPSGSWVERRVSKSAAGSPDNVTY